MLKGPFPLSLLADKSSLICSCCRQDRALILAQTYANSPRPLLGSRRDGVMLSETCRDRLGPLAHVRIVGVGNSSDSSDNPTKMTSTPSRVQCFPKWSCSWLTWSIKGTSTTICWLRCSPCQHAYQNHLESRIQYRFECCRMHNQHGILVTLRSDFLSHELYRTTWCSIEYICSCKQPCMLSMLQDGDPVIPALLQRISTDL